MNGESGPELLGRSEELATLVGAFDAALAGRPSAVLVSGDAGVGKSRLVAELVRHARRQQALVLAGAAVDIADALPFWPVLSAVRSAARAHRGTETHALLSAWLRRLPGAGDPGPAAAPVQLLDLLDQLVMDLVAVGPVVLVIEDLQWADRSTRDLLAHLVANLGDEPLLVVGTIRTDSTRRAPELAVTLAELRRLRTVTSLALAPFPRPVLAELVTALAPDRPDLEQLVWRRSGGNAFIAEETVRAVLGGDLRGLPATLREIVLGRIGLLSPAAQQVTRVLATAVGPLRHGPLADAVELDARGLRDALREAVDFGVVQVDDARESYQLRHGLLIEVVAGDLLPGERADLHRRLALALTSYGERDDPGLAARLAHHWQAAGDAEQAVRASVAAARASESVHAHTEAHQHWLRAAELSGPRDPTVPDERACLDRAARAAALAGDHDVAVTLLDRLLREPAAPPGLQSALLTARMGSSLAAAGRDADAQSRYRAAVALLPTTGAEAERAQVLAGYAATLLRALDVERARTVALDALELARRAGMATVEARLLSVLGFSAAYLDDTESSWTSIEEAVRVAEATGEAEAIGEAHLRRAELLAGPLNRLVEGIELARGSLERVRALGLERTVGVALLTSAANALFRLGRWDEAAETVAQAWSLGPRGAAVLDVRLARARLELGRGELDVAAADLEAVDLLTAATAGPRERIPLLVLHAALALWHRDPAAALRYVDAGLVIADAGVGDIWSLAPLVWHGARAWADGVAAGRPPPPPAVLERLERHRAALARRGAQTVPSVRAVVEAFALMCAAEVARAGRDAEPAVWERVATLFEAQLQPYPAAYARMRFAEALLDRGGRSTATFALRTAERTARGLGARPLLGDVIELAGRGRVVLTDPAATDPVDGPTGEPVATPLDALTARELEVLVELAEGRTNRAIAERLFISEKTVGVHVARIFAKIGVHSRVQASALLLRSRATVDPS